MESNEELKQTVNIKIGDNAFNAIRLVCCLIVIFGHCLDLSNAQVSYRSFIDMHVCVCVFFILSGFWVYQSYLRCKSLKEYIIKRVVRLLPMYYIAVFGFALVCVLYTDLSVGEYFKNSGFWKYLFWNSIFLNFVHPDLPGVFAGNAVNGALWTIKVEIGFYIVLPLIDYFLKLLNDKKKQNILLLLIYGFSILWNFLFGKYASKLHLPSQLAYQLPGFMSFFVSGMLFVLNWDYLTSKLKYLIIPAIICFILYFILKTEFVFPMALTICVMFVGLNFRFLKNIGRPIDFSYGMYLYHFPIINIFVLLGFFEKGLFFNYLLIVSIVFFITFVVEKFIQTNIMKLVIKKE